MLNFPLDLLLLLLFIIFQFSLTAGFDDAAATAATATAGGGGIVGEREGRTSFIHSLILLLHQPDINDDGSPKGASFFSKR